MKLRTTTDAQPSHDRPTPTVAELERAALDFCGLDWAVVRQRHEDDAHPYTLPHQLSDRCLEGLYMVLLLERGFGFQRHERAITYALEVCLGHGCLVAASCLRTNFIADRGPGSRVDVGLRPIRCA